MNNFDAPVLSQADVLRVFKKDCGAKFVVRQRSEELITLVMLNRGKIDGHGGVSRFEGFGVVQYDVEGKVHAVTFKGFKVILLMKSECG